MASCVISVSFHHRHIPLLEEWKEESGMNRSAIIRNALDAYTGEDVAASAKVEDLEQRLDEAEARIEALKEENQQLKAQANEKREEPRIVRPRTWGGSR